jgi:diacylglycerol O-acyltransferase
VPTQFSSRPQNNTKEGESPVPKRERMSSVDTAWLRMDRPANRMVIAGVMMFDTQVDPERLKAALAAGWLAYDRFRQRPVQDATGSYWEDVADFSLDDHLRRIRLPGAAGPAELKKFVGRLVAKPLDPRRPLWEYCLVENYRGGSAVVVRIHHCYADGIALIGVMLSLTSTSPDAPPAAAIPRARRAPRRAADDGMLAQFFEPMSDALAAARRMSGGLIEKYVALVRDPVQALDYARIAADVVRETAELATMPDDSRTRFKGHATVAKKVAWTDPLPLDEVKAVGRVLECSVNDVLLACVAGALRDYLLAKGDAVAGVEIRALVPVNLRPPGNEHKLGNRFGLVTLLLPLHLANPLARLYEVHARMEALKTSYQPVISLGILGVAGLVPKAVQQQALDLLANKATAVMTNVPGPQETLYLAGGRLTDLMFWVPQSGDIGMGVSILSYNGGVQFGLITDAHMVGDPERIVAAFRPEFERLLLTVLMEPWEGRRDPHMVERELARALARKGKPPARTRPIRARISPVPRPAAPSRRPA